MCASVDSLQKGNIFMEAVMKRKQLSFGIDKCSVIVFDKNSKNVRENSNRANVIKISNEEIKIREKDTYLGDILHEGGLSQSVKATVDKRHGRTLSAIIEVSAILNDYRIDSIGGLKAGLDIIELAVIPSLLHNAETWIEMDSKTEKR